MFKKLRFTLVSFLATSLLFGSMAIGQTACGDRYMEEIFSEVAMETVTYTEGANAFLMDIYQPVGDTLSERPVIIMAHGGSFAGGTRTEGDIVQFCNYFAKRGYVTASIQYSLTTITNLVDSLFMMDIVMKAVGDGKAAVRYFRADAATTNNYKIDSDQIFFGGNSAGAILAMHLAYLNDVNEAPAYLLDIMNNNGGIEGQSGHPGYSSSVKGIINLAGGLHRRDFIGDNDQDVFCVSVHGDADGVVPYDCNEVYWGDPVFGPGFQLVHICGSGELEEDLTTHNVPHTLWTLPGADHTPWSADPALMDEVNVYVRDYIYDFVECAPVVQPTGIANASEYAINLFPNPASQSVKIEMQNNDWANAAYIISNLAGQTVKRGNLAANNVIDVADLGQGVYTIQLLTENKSLIEKLMIN